MWHLLDRELADVDSKFKKVGYFSSEVLAAPDKDQAFAIKSMPSSHSDKIEEHQSTLFVTYEVKADCDFDHVALSPGALYEYDGRTFVELKYFHSLGGLVSIRVYFLVDTDECTFGYWDSINQEMITPVDLEVLLYQDLIRRIGS